MENKQNNYKNICRVCSNKVPDREQFNLIFETQYQESYLVDMFNACTPLKMTSNDGLPEKICKNCKRNLITSYKFQLLCIQTDHKLRSALELNGPDLEVEHPIVPLLVNELDNSKEILKDDQIEIIKIEESILKNSTQNDCDELINDHDDVKPKLESDTELIENVIFDADPDNDIDFDDSNKVVENPIISETPELLALDINNSNVDDTSNNNDVTFKKRFKKSKGKLKINKIPRTKKKFECLVCGKIFDKNYRLLRHSNIHNTVGKPYECDVCKHRFAAESSLVRHTIKHTDILTSSTTRINVKPRIYKCTECEREFLKQESLSSHMKTHKNDVGIKEYLCEYCPKTFPKLNSLTRHTKIHDEAKSHKCNLCERTFSLGGQLIDHLNKHRGLKPHVCQICKKGFTQSCTLKDHLRTHNGETPFLCSECGKVFNNGSNLRQHLMRHTGIKPYFCTECPSRFSCKGGLKSHMATHTGLKPYICDICGSSFTKPYSLGKHKRIHTGERPYSCEMCDMRFNSSDHVKRHMRTHTGEKPYKCKYCERAFAQSNDLVKHTRSHVGDNTYQCLQCPAAFRLQSELRTHAAIHFQLQQNRQNIITHDISSLQLPSEDLNQPISVIVPSLLSSSEPLPPPPPSSPSPLPQHAPTLTFFSPEQQNHEQEQIAQQTVATSIKYIKIEIDNLEQTTAET